jgi:predicted acetyltransferase
MSQFSVRQARETDLDRLVAIHQNAFPDSRSATARRRNFVQNARFRADDLFVIEDRADVVGHAFFANTEGWFGGNKLRVGTIASVGVAPEARGQGVATALLAHLHEKSNAAENALDILYPFSHAFYRRLGYAGASGYVRLSAHPLAFPAGPRQSLRPVTGDDSAPIATLYERFCEERTGMLVRSSRAWERLWTDEALTHICIRSGRHATAYVTFSLRQNELHGETRLQIREWAWADARSQRALWHWARSMAGQVNVIEVDISREDPLLDAVSDAAHGRFGTAAVEHPVGVFAAGPAIRIVNLARALSARGWPQESLTFAVGEARFVVHAGTAKPAHKNPPVDVTISPEGIAQVAFGGVSVRSLVAAGRLEGASAEAIARAERTFSTPAYFSADPF